MLMGIVGELGCGKTLSLTYFGLRNYFKYEGKRTLFANYHLHTLEGKPIEYTYVGRPIQIDDIRNGIFLGDELWIWADSRLSMGKRNKFITAILAKSRHRDLDIIFTTQSFGQIDVRIRRICDFIAIPSFNERTNKCTLKIYTHPSGYLLKVLKFDARPFFEAYDTTEEIEIPDDM